MENTRPYTVYSNLSKLLKKQGTGRSVCMSRRCHRSHTCCPLVRAFCALPKSDRGGAKGGVGLARGAEPSARPKTEANRFWRLHTIRTKFCSGVSRQESFGYFPIRRYFTVIKNKMSYKGLSSHWTATFRAGEGRNVTIQDSTPS